MPIDSVSSGSPKPITPQAPVEAPKPVVPAAEPVAAQPAVKGSGFETPPAKPVSITGKYAAPPMDPAAGRDDLKADVSAARMSGVAPQKPVNPAAVPLEYVEKGGAVIQKGQSGESVTELQEALNRQGAGLPTDGKFDAKTETAVRDFQKKNGLPPDGKVGQETLNRLVPKDADAVKKDPALSKLDPAVQKGITDRLGKSDAQARNHVLGVAKAPGFEKLTPAQQQQMLGMLDKSPDSAALTKDLKTVAGGKGFQAMDKDNQKLALDQLEKNAQDPKARETLTRLYAEPGIGALDKHEQTVLLNQVGGTNDKISTSSREALDAKMKAGGFPTTAEGQKAELHDFLVKQDFAEWHTKEGAWAGRTTKAQSVTGPESIPDGGFYLDANKPADKYQVKIGEQTIPVIVPKGTPKAEVDKLVETMEALPPANRQIIKKMVLEPSNNTAEPRPFDALDGAVHAYPEKSGMTSDQQKSAMIHESAHLIDKQMQKNDPNWDANWRKAMKSDMTAPGQYSKKSEAEDFAEAYLTYKMTENNPKEFAEMKAMYPERFKLIEDVEKRAKNGTLEG